MLLNPDTALCAGQLTKRHRFWTRRGPEKEVRHPAHDSCNVFFFIKKKERRVFPAYLTGAHTLSPLKEKYTGPGCFPRVYPRFEVGETCSHSATLQ